MNVHELRLYREERDPPGKNGCVEGTEVRLGHRFLVVEAIVTVDHHGPVAVVTTSRVADEVLLALGALLIHVAEAAGLRLGVVVTLAVSSCYWITSVSVAITVAFDTRGSQRPGHAKSSWKTSFTAWPSGPIATINAGVISLRMNTRVCVAKTVVSTGNTMFLRPHKS